MKIKSLLCIILTLFLVLYVQLVSQELPEPTFTDPVGDVSPASVDLTGGWFVQQGDSLLIGYQMAGPFAYRPIGWSLSEFFLDTDGDDWYYENNVDFHDYGGGNWFGSKYLLFDHEKYTFTSKVMVPVKVWDDGKTMTCKISLVGTGWDEVNIRFSGWYKIGFVGHQVPHIGGDWTEENIPFKVDHSQITQLVDKVGDNCIIKVPEPYSATADAKNITGVVDEMVNLVRSQIGMIVESDKKFSVKYENFTNYAHPMVQWSGTGNQFGCRIPGQYWVDEPDWYSILDGVINQTLLELSDGLEQVFLVQSAYQRPIPIDGEGWYCTKDDSINGFKFTANHKWSFKALLGIAYENCYAFNIAENLSDGEAKTAIMNKKAEMAAAWNDFTGTAENLTPDIMTGLLLSLTDDLSWTERIFEEIIPKNFDLEDADTTAFDRILNNYILNPAYSPTLWDSVVYYTQQHLGWYSSIASVQAAVIDVATNADIYSILQGINGFPLDRDVFNTTKELLTEVAIDNETEMPIDFKLSQNYPNPFNPTTNIGFSIPEQCEISLKIYNILGKQVEVIVDKQRMQNSYYNFVWDASKLSSGVYFYRLETGQNTVMMKKCILIK